MIFPVWQEVGQSSHLLARACGELLQQPATHTGTLDPMAEGVLVILTDEDRFAKGALSDWQKTYDFSILWGVETDSGDALGLIQRAAEQSLDFEQLNSVLKNFSRIYEQTVPAFSARRWQGKSSFDWARVGDDNISLPIKKRQVELSEIEMLNIEKIMALLQLHEEKIAQVSGDFRQQEILESWQNHLTGSTNFTITHHQVTTSAGAYIRQLVQDIAAQLNMPAMTWSITRQVNGPYHQQDCLELAELVDLN